MIQPFVKTGATLAHEIFCQLLRSRLRFWRSTGLAPVVRMLRKSQKVAAVWLCLVPSSHWYWLPSGYVKIALEHGPFIVDLRIYLSKMVIFHSYVSLPEGMLIPRRYQQHVPSNRVLRAHQATWWYCCPHCQQLAAWYDMTSHWHHIDMIFSNGMLMYVSMIPLNSIVMQIWNTWNWS